MTFSRFLPAFLLTAFLLASLPTIATPLSSQTETEKRGKFLKTLRELKLSTDQTQQVFRLIREYRGRLRSEQFRVELLKILTPEQVELLDRLKSPPGSREIPDRIQADLNVVYAERPETDPKYLSLDIYRPKESTQPLPVMVMIHGGGWRIGDKSNRSVGIEKAKYFTSQGFVYVSINYRLTPQVQHPGHIVDVAEAIAWIHDKIGKYGGDAEKLFVMGHSAGAHLAALVATDQTRLANHQKKLSIIKGVVLLDGAGYDIPLKLKLGNTVANSMYRDAFTDDVEIQKNASPISHVESGKGIPPFLIIPIARRRDSNRLSEDLQQALLAAEVEASIHVAEGKTHISVNSEIGTPNDQPTAAMMKFLKDSIPAGE